MKIGLIGAGRLGICLSLLIEQAGYNVLVSDIRPDYVSDLNQKKISTKEPDVQWLLSRTKNFEATTDNQRVIEECDFIICLVATPSLPDGSYDVSAVWNVVEDFKRSDSKLNGKTLIVGCTTNPGDCDKFKEQLDYFGMNVVYNPEFIAQGSIVKDLRNADMVLIGGADDETYEVMQRIYEKIQSRPPRWGRMSTTAAELVKLAINCFLTTKISYANMVGQVLSLSGHEDEIDSVLNAIGSDSRIGSKYLNFGYGYGGPCLPRDNRSFAAYAEKLGLQYNLGATTDNFNEEHLKFLTDWVLKKNKDNLPFAFPSVAYKNGTDIITESHQYKLCCALLDLNYKVYVLDDIVKDQCDDRIIWGKPFEEVYWIDL